ncbi:TIGR03619 family F420-dependent LLM class oxidoreductase [Amycolatopsis sp. FDAARGOS 1241]|uniref:TIGR03619 family F420-dependent LLM class oxidoreductase n=1 Tax=Amycolatopsis sp. FDAARGOS 1241 TaxID=2778070 RepID=UPI00195199B1|nr:TIGR03619 family F420-dependent LLM class oxidoreductase [Amycolatopsis sp. FDAARGOS 1241]QRP42858.1 TIGR03619 family F420-dependent LLM class oxidoreductase [Amycolatopsis sp. FDAARGOS 1241]
MATDLGPALVDVALAVEERGLDGLWLPDHTHMPVTRSVPYPMGGDLPERYKRNLDPLAGLALAAAVTERIRVGTGVLLPAQRDPIATARALATLDQQTGGRVVVGAGYGWNVEEMTDHGVDPVRRRARTREHVLAMRRLWEDEVASYAGPHVAFGPSWSWPKPVQRPLPVLIGGSPSRVLCRHVAEYGDGWIPLGARGLEEGVDAVRDAVASTGRDPAELEIVPFLGSGASSRHWDRCAVRGATEVAVDVPHDGSLFAALDVLGAAVAAWRS